MKSGRDLFEKWRPLITFCLHILALLPRSFRQKLLEHWRNTNGKIGLGLRYVLLKTLSASCGDNVAVFPGVYFENLESLALGNNVSIHQMCYIDAEGGVEIGNDVSIAHRSTILSSNHGYEKSDIPIKYQPMTLAKTCVQDNVWIGCGCSILAGVTIGEGAIIGAGAVVTNDVESGCIAVGVPAKKIKKRVGTEG